MGNDDFAPYDIRTKKGQLLISSGSILTDSKRNVLNRRHDWHIDAPPPFALNDSVMQQYKRKYDRALQRYSALFNECIKTGGFPSASLHTLAEFVSQFNQATPHFAMLSQTSGLDSYTEAHSVNVAAVCAMIGYFLKLTKPERADLIAAGLLHDIGKTLVPRRLLLAKRKLTPHEFAVVRTHAELGAEIIGGSYDAEIVNAVRYHHVRIEKGYPADVEYHSLPNISKWVGVADVYEALCAVRPYRQKMNPYRAMKILCEEGVINLDFHFARSFSEVFSKLYVGSVVSLSNGTFGVIRAVSEINGVYTPLIETTNGEILTPSGDVDIRDIIGFSEA